MNQKGQSVSEPASQRTMAEWVTLAVSALIVLGMLGVLVYDLIAGSNRPPVIAVVPDFDATYQEEGKYYLPLTVVNEGGRTAADVTVHFVLPREGEASSESSTFTIRFLAPGERAEAVAIFNAQPHPERLQYSSNYLHP